jgi:hypothetical protein
MKPRERKALDQELDAMKQLSFSENIVRFIG